MLPVFTLYYSLPANAGKDKPLSLRLRAAYPLLALSDRCAGQCFALLLSVIKSADYISGLYVAVVRDQFTVENCIRDRTCAGKVDKCKFASDFSAERVLSVYICLHSYIMLIPTETPPVRDTREVGAFRCF